MSELVRPKQMHPARSKDSAFSLELVALGGALILFGVLVPSATIAEHLTSSSQVTAQQLLTGASLFRLGLGILGLVTIVLSYRDLPFWTSSKAQVRQRAEPTPRIALVSLSTILVSSLALRLYGLGSGLWYDEIVTDVLYARLPYGEIVTSYASENQHFLYSLMAHASYQIFGESAWALRLPAVMFGVGSIAAMYLFAREVASTKEALLSAALLSFSYTHIWFSQNARGYSGLLCLTLVASWLYLRGLKYGESRDWLLYAVAIALGFYIHVTMAFVTAAHLLAYVCTVIRTQPETFSRRWSGLILGFGLAALLTFQLYSLVLPQLVGSMGREATAVTTWKNPLWTILEIARGLQANFAGGAVALIAIVVFGVGAMSYAQRRPIVLELLVVPTVVGSVVTIGLGHPLWPRFFFFAVGFGALIVIRGTILLAEMVGARLRLPEDRRAWIGTVIGCGLVLVSAKTLPFAYLPKQDYRGAATFVEAQEQPGDSVVMTGLAAFPYAKEYHKPWTDVESVDALDTIRRHAKRTWLIYTFPTVLAADDPDMMQSILHDFQVVAQFPSTVDGGTIVVCRSDEPPSFVARH